jgi:hypothetical protein
VDNAAPLSYMINLESGGLPPKLAEHGLTCTAPNARSRAAGSGASVGQCGTANMRSYYAGINSFCMTSILAALKKFAEFSSTR